MLGLMKIVLVEAFLAGLPGWVGTDLVEAFLAASFVLMRWSETVLLVVARCCCYYYSARHTAVAVLVAAMDLE